MLVRVAQKHAEIRSRLLRRGKPRANDAYRDGEDYQTLAALVAFLRDGKRLPNDRFEDFRPLAEALVNRGEMGATILKLFDRP